MHQKDGTAADAREQYAYCNSAEDCYNRLLTKNSDIAFPKLSIGLLHLDMTRIDSITLYRVVQLERVPTMINEHLPVKIDFLVGIHHKTSQLREGIDIRRVRMEIAVVHDARKGYFSNSFHSVIIQRNLNEPSIIGVEIC